MAAFKFSGGLGGRSASGRSWRQGGYREGRIYADGGSEEDERNVVPSHHEWQLQGQGRQRAAAGAAQRMNSSPSTTLPGTMSPSQPQRQTPGVRNFSLFGGAYTWSSDQEQKDLKDPNFNGGQSGDTLKQPAVAAPAAEPAAPAVAAGGWDPSVTGEDYGTIAAEVSSAGAGNKAFQAAATQAASALRRGGLVLSGAGAGAQFGQGPLPGSEAGYYVPGEKAVEPTDKALAFGNGVFYQPPEGRGPLSRISASGLTPEEVGRNRKLAPRLSWGTDEDLNAGLEEQQQAWAKEYQTEITPVDLGKAVVPRGRPGEPWTLEGPPAPDRKKGSGFLLW